MKEATYSNAGLDGLLRKRLLLLQGLRALEVSLLEQVKDLDNGLGEQVAVGADAADAAAGEAAEQKVALAAKRGERVGLEHGRQPADLGDAAARQLDADDLAGVALGQARHRVRVQVDAVAHGREVVDDQGQRALGGDLVIKPLDDRLRRRLAKVGRGQQQAVVGAGGRRVGEELERLLGAVARHARHDGEVRAHGLPRDLQQLRPLLARQQERLAVAAQHHQARQPRRAQVLVVLGLVIGDDGVCVRVEERDRGRPDAGGWY